MIFFNTILKTAIKNCNFQKNTTKILLNKLNFKTTLIFYLKIALLEDCNFQEKKYKKNIKRISKEYQKNI